MIGDGQQDVKDVRLYLRRVLLGSLFAHLLGHHCLLPSLLGRGRGDHCCLTCCFVDVVKKKMCFLVVTECEVGAVAASNLLFARGIWLYKDVV